MSIRRSPRVTLAALALLLAIASPASAFEPPELFVRTAAAQPGEWIPLASAPRVDFMGGWEIGYRVQPSGAPDDIQSASLSVTGVPDGVPNQRFNATPICGTQVGPPGQIVAIGRPVRYEGNGSYTVSVSVGPYDRARHDACFGGPSSTGTFSTNVGVTPEVAGTPLSVRLVPLNGDVFSGVRAADPPGGLADVECALDATVKPDGSLSGRVHVAGERGDRAPEIFERELTPPGAWTCVARGVVEDDYETPLGDGEEIRYVAGPWSPPLPVTVKADFRRDWVSITNPRARRITWTYKAEFPHAAVGGTGTLETHRLVRCRGAGKPVFKRVSRGRGTFDAKGLVKIKLPKPKANGDYIVRLSIAGAPFYRDGNAPGLVSFAAKRGRLYQLPHPPVC